MKVIGMRFCTVANGPAAEQTAEMFRKLGLPERELKSDGEGFAGAVFPIEQNEENSWLEIWPAGANMPEMTMLQIVVDDADAFAEHARQNGLDPKGPDDAHGERIYYLAAPGGMPVSFQSKIRD